MTFVASFTIYSSLLNNNFTVKDELDEYIFNSFSYYVKIKIAIFEIPIPIKTLLNELDFIMHKDKFGIYFRSSNLTIPEKNYYHIISKTN